MSDPQVDNSQRASPDALGQLRHDVRNQIFCTQMLVQLCSEHFAQNKLTREEMDDLVESVQQLSQGVETLLSQMPRAPQPK